MAAAQVVDRQEFEEAEAAPVEVKIATKDSGRLSMSIFGHVNASVRHAKEAAAARAESEVDLDADGPGEGEASEEGALVEAVSVNGSLEDWFGTDGAADLLPDRIVNATGTELTPNLVLHNCLVFCIAGLYVPRNSKSEHQPIQNTWAGILSLSPG